MVNTIKFSQFTEANLNDSTTETVGLATGTNIKTPKVVTWTTATRPTPPPSWVIGANSDLQEYEFWDPISSDWVQLTSSVDLTSTFILETPDSFLPNSFALSTLTTGILKNTTGTGVPSISAPLTSIDSLTTLANEIIYTTAPNTYATTSLSPFSKGLLADTSASAWRTDLGVPAFPVSVSQGGTGDTSFTPFSVICGGTTSTGNLQSVASVGTLGQILTSNGAGALPTWQNSSSSGIVNPGLINELAYYAASGSTLSGLATASNGTLVTDNSGVPSISSTLPIAVQTNITELGTINTGTWNGSIIGLSFGGTNANLTANAGAIVYSTASAFALSAVGTTGQLLQSNGTSAPSWTSATFPTSVGSAGTILRSDGTNWVASTATFANTYTASNLLYSNGANNVVGLVTGNNGVLITSGIGVPSISSTLPLAVQTNITELGTITVGVWNGTAIDVPHGGTGDTSFTAYSVICAGTTSTGNFQNVVGVGSVGQVLTSSGAGALPTWTNASGTGTVNSGLINQLAYYAASGTTVSGLATANDGILVTSNSGVPSILAGPASTGNILQANNGAAPSFSTATYPSIATSTGTILRANGTNWIASTATFADTYAASVLLYSNGTNTVTGLATGNNGLLVTSSSGVPSILAGPGTTGNIFQSNAAAAPSFSTATYPSTTTINQLLYSSSANVVSGLATANNGILVTSSGGVPSIGSTIPNAVLGNVTKITTQTFSSGSGTYTTPSNVTHIRVRGWGGGGGGGGAAAAGAAGSAAGGGGGGGYFESFITSPAGTYSYGVGGGGAGGTAGNNNGTGGGNTTFSTFTATGGGGGTGGASIAGGYDGAGGSGGGASGGNINIGGSTGNYGFVVGATNATVKGGDGGSAAGGGGGLAQGQIGGATPSTGQTFGGGGAGAAQAAAGGALAGGAGAAGFIFVEEYYVG